MTLSLLPTEHSLDMSTKDFDLILSCIQIGAVIYFIDKQPATHQVAGCLSKYIYC